MIMSMEGVLGVLGRAFGIVVKFYAIAILTVPIPAVLQEAKIWKPPVPKLTIWGCLKVYWFNVGWLTLTQIGATVLLPAKILGFHEFVEKQASVVVERYTGYFLCYVFIGPVVVKGKENLFPPNDDGDNEHACVFIANHSSQIDAGAILLVHRRWKWIVKRSILFLPGVGPIMMLGRHISIRRSKIKSKSIKVMYDAANKALTTGQSMLVFPQGTRRITERLPFKDGAFNMAMQAEVPLMPISIEVPSSAWNSTYPYCLLWKKLSDMDPVVLTVHKPIPVTQSSDKEALKKQAFDVIYSVLPDHTNGTDKKTTIS